MPEFGYYIVLIVEGKTIQILAGANLFIFAQLIVKEIGGCILSHEEYLACKD